MHIRPIHFPCIEYTLWPMAAAAAAVVVVIIRNTANIRNNPSCDHYSRCECFLSFHYYSYYYYRLYRERESPCRNLNTRKHSIDGLIYLFIYYCAKEWIIILMVIAEIVHADSGKKMGIVKHFWLNVSPIFIVVCLLVVVNLIAMEGNYVWMYVIIVIIIIIICMNCHVPSNESILWTRPLLTMGYWL